MSDAAGSSRHYGEELNDFLEGTLAEPLRSEIAAHVAQCERCTRELAALRWVKTEMRQQVAEVAPPPELEARLRAALDAEDSRTRQRREPRITRRAWISGGVLAAAAALVLMVTRRPRSRSLTSFIADDFVAYRSGAMPLAIESTDPQVVDAYFVRNGITFRTRVFDLAMMAYRLVGGRVNRLDGRPSALFAYRGSDGVALVCQMYQGRIDELPSTTDVRQNGDIPFSVYHRDALTLVFWPEGDVVCVLASDAPTETVVQLAFAKAMRVAV